MRALSHSNSTSNRSSFYCVQYFFLSLSLSLSLHQVSFSITWWKHCFELYKLLAWSELGRGRERVKLRTEERGKVWCSDEWKWIQEEVKKMPIEREREKEGKRKNIDISCSFGCKSDRTPLEGEASKSFLTLHLLLVLYIFKGRERGKKSELESKKDNSNVNWEWCVPNWHSLQFFFSLSLSLSFILCFFF